jgi:hypothetical protein
MAKKTGLLTRPLADSLRRITGQIFWGPVSGEGASKVSFTFAVRW